MRPRFSFGGGDGVNPDTRPSRAWSVSAKLLPPGIRSWRERWLVTQFSQSLRLRVPAQVVLQRQTVNDPPRGVPSLPFRSYRSVEGGRSSRQQDLSITVGCGDWSEYRRYTLGRDCVTLGLWTALSDRMRPPDLLRQDTRRAWTSVASPDRSRVMLTRLALQVRRPSTLQPAVISVGL